MQKIRKILRAVSEKTALPNNQPINQPTNYYQQHRFCRTWLTPVKKNIYSTAHGFLFVLESNVNYFTVLDSLS